MKPLLAISPFPVAALCCAIASACGGEVTASSEDTSPAGDAAAAIGDAATASCSCPAGQVWRNHACLSTLDIGCGAPCSSDAACGEAATCEPCGASSSCDTRDCRPSCAPTELHMGPIPADSLRIAPTQGNAGASNDIAILGFAWYIGALGYGVRVGDEVVVEFGGGSDCSFALTAPPRPPGRVPVWVSQYGAGDWVLAGFFTYSAGDNDQCTQPGFPCESPGDCCSTVDAEVGCTAGRCRAK